VAPEIMIFLGIKIFHPTATKYLDGILRQLIDDHAKAKKYGESWQGILKGGSITVPLTSSSTGLDQSVLQIKTKIVHLHTADSKLVKQEVIGTVKLPPLLFHG